MEISAPKRRSCSGVKHSEAPVLYNPDVLHENAFEMAVSSVRFGVGVTREVGLDLADLGARRVLVLTDTNLRRLPPVAVVLESLQAAGVASAVYDRVRV